MDYEPIRPAPAELAMAETRRHQIRQIAELFAVPVAYLERLDQLRDPQREASRLLRAGLAREWRRHYAAALRKDTGTLR